MELKFEVYTKISKPIAEVFQAIYDPQLLSKYFTSGGASAPMDAGTTVMWAFKGFPGSYPVKIIECVPPERLVFEWEILDSKELSHVTILLEALEENVTMVKVAEKGWPADQVSLEKSYGNCMGWSQMITHLKVFLEYDIILRDTAY